MPDVVCLGELLIDFTSTVPGASLAETPAFEKHAGGAPANVAVGVCRLGGSAAFLGMVGEDGFGEYLATTLAERGVDIGGLRYASAAHTTLAFVALRADGEREFVFYRNPGADMLYGPENLDAGIITSGRIFHHGSISFISPANRAATLRAIDLAQAAGCLISYDPNLRLNLWENAAAARAGLLLGLPTADLLKVSEEEMTFITGETDLARGMDALLAQGPSIVLVTCGAAGCVYAWGAYQGRVPGCPAVAVDTTGAGDAFVAGVLYQLTQRAYPPLEFTREEVASTLQFANAVAARVVTRRGAIPAMPTLAEVSDAWD